MSQTELFQSESAPHSNKEEEPEENAPLAEQLRPKKIEEVIGQNHILGEEKPLSKIIQNQKWSSIIFYGPPGVGKTTIAEIIASQEKRRIVKMNGALQTGKDIKAQIEAAIKLRDKPLIFIDEIHRFNRGVQDTLLPAIEKGYIKMIGTTTHHPGIYLVSALMSRSLIFELKAIATPKIIKILQKACKVAGIQAEEKALETIAQKSDGDSRQAINQLETLGSIGKITDALVHEQRTYRRHDKNGDSHYDLISAMIKSIRGSDPDAALFWMLRGLEAGEDPRYIARRLIIHASEDIGLADHRALLVANAAWEACDRVGMPECKLNLSHATIFLASVPKSGTVTAAISKAIAEIEHGAPIPIPDSIRDNHAPDDRSLNKGMKRQENYLFSHNYKNGIAPQRYIPENIQFLEFRQSGEETEIAQRVKDWREQRKQLTQN